MALEMKVRLPKFVFLDIDETLGATLLKWSKIDTAIVTPVEPKKLSFQEIDLFWFSRPGLKLLINEFQKHGIHYGIWTAAKKPYASCVVDHLFEDIEYKPHWLLHDVHCTWYLEFLKKDVPVFLQKINDNDPQFLDAMYESAPLEVWKAATPNNIWLIDNNEDHFGLGTYSWNIPDFDYQALHDSAFYDIIDFLRKMKT